MLRDLCTIKKIEILVIKIGNHVSLDNLSQTLKNLKNKILMKNISKSDNKNNKFLFCRYYYFGN